MPDNIADQSMIDAVFRDKVLRARQMSMEQRLFESAALFDLNCEFICGAIRSQFPEFSDEQVQQEYFRRLQIARTIDATGIFRDVGLIDE